MGPWNLQDRLGRDHQDSKLVYVSLGTRFRITRIQFSNYKWVLANLGSAPRKYTLLFLSWRNVMKDCKKYDVLDFTL